MRNLNNKIKEVEIISIRKDTTLLDALRKMDQVNRKLLLVLKENKFYSLLSIGDIQRALLKNFPLDTKVEVILREKVNVAYIHETDDEIKDKMISLRAEFIPMIDENSEIKGLFFWSDIFDSSYEYEKGCINIPVVIMAGGKGSRLKPITNIIPKPLIPLGEKPIMEMIINRFNFFGCRDFYITTNYKHELIVDYFSKIPDKEYSISYFVEDIPLGTAGSLTMVKNQIDSTFIVSNCDILIDENYNEIVKYHKLNKNKITVVSALKHYKIPYGTLTTKEDGRLVSMHEKPEHTYYNNTGVYIVEPEMLDLIPEKKVFHMTHLIEAAMKKNEQVGCFPVTEGSWFDIGVWPEYQRTLKTFENRFADRK
jgi:dTDP-glucose pyrophosphorylase